MSYTPRGNYNKRRGNSNLPHNMNTRSQTRNYNRNNVERDQSQKFNKDTSNVSDTQDGTRDNSRDNSRDTYRRGRGGYRNNRNYNSERFQNNSERRTAPNTSKTPYPEKGFRISLIKCTISPNSTYHFIKNTVESINLENPVEFQNSIDLLNNIYNEFENVRRAIMKIPVEVETVINTEILEHLAPTTSYQTLFASTFDLHITPDTTFFNPYQWVFIFLNALNGFADGFSSIITSVPASYFPVFYDIARKYHICLRKVGLSIKREHLKKTYPKFFMSAEELAEAKIEFTPEDLKDKERIWKEYDEAKSAGIYIVADLCKLFNVSTKDMSKDQIKDSTDAFVEYSHDITNPEVLKLWRLLVLNPFFCSHVANKEHMNPIDYGIDKKFHLLCTLPSSVKETCNHVAMLRAMAQEINISRSNSSEKIVVQPSKFSTLINDSSSSDDTVETDTSDSIDHTLKFMEDTDKFEYNRRLIYIIHATLKMLEISTTSEDVINSWAVGISLIHDNLINLYRNVNFGESYSPFSNEGRTADMITRFDAYTQKELIQCINRYTKNHRLSTKCTFDQLPAFHLLLSMRIEDVVSNILDTVKHASLRESSSTYCSTDISIAVELLYGILEQNGIMNRCVAKRVMLEMCKDITFESNKLNNNVLLFICNWILHQPFMQEVLKQPSEVSTEDVSEMSTQVIDLQNGPAEMSLLEKLIQNEDITEMIRLSTSLFDINTPRQISVLESFIIFIRSVRFLDFTDDTFMDMGSKMWSCFRTICEGFIKEEPKLATLKWKLTDFEIEEFKQLPSYRSIVNIKG